MDGGLFAPPHARGLVYAGMGYIIAIVILLLVVPLIFIMLSRRTTTGGGARGKLHDQDITVSQPSADQPTPPPDRPGGEHRLPPG